LGLDIPVLCTYVGHIKLLFYKYFAALLHLTDQEEAVPKHEKGSSLFNSGFLVRSTIIFVADKCLM
jgi:hypothetical protein